MSETSKRILQGCADGSLSKIHAVTVTLARELEAAEGQLATIEAQLAEDGERLDALLATARRDALREAAKWCQTASCGDRWTAEGRCAYAEAADHFRTIAEDKADG